MNGVILYKSRYGVTKKHANWISERTEFPCMETEQANIMDVSQYDIIVLGGGIHAGGVAGLTFLKKHIEQLENKRIIVFCTGASPYEKSAFQRVLARNMAGNLAGIPVFYCWGAWNLEGMTFDDRTLCKLLLRSVRKKNPEDCAAWEKALLEAGDQNCDWTSKTFIEPIIEEIYR